MKDSVSEYLSQRLTAYNPFSNVPVNPNVGLAIAIPAYSESHLPQTIESLLKCAAPGVDVEIIIAINQPISATEAESEQNQLTLQHLKKLPPLKRGLSLVFSHVVQFPDQIAGAGMARKIAMDEAVIRLSQSQQKIRVISCLDADCTVAPNYLREVYRFFETRRDMAACSIYYEHPLFDNMGILHEPIVKYELHLRYLVQALRFTNHPHALHTVGSSMAVDLEGYCSQWGMNKRKAGEDFYFFQKFMEIGKAGALNTTAVYPSHRKSHRVPFGTGRAMMEWGRRKDILTSNIQSYLALKRFFESITWGSKLSINDPLISKFLMEQRFDEDSIYEHTSSGITFRKRFFRWFNAFRVIKFLHFMRGQGFPDQPIGKEAQKLLEILKYSASETYSEYEQLLIFRQLDRNC